MDDDKDNRDREADHRIKVERRRPADDEQDRVERARLLESLAAMAGGREVDDELARLVALLVALRSAQQEEYDAAARERRNDPASVRVRRLARRRARTREAYAAVVAYLESPAVVAAHPDLLRFRATLPLRDGLHALDDLAAGCQPDLFELPPGQPRRASPNHARLRGRAAAVVEMLRRAGEEPEKAMAIVAETLDDNGYRIPRGSKSGRGDDRIWKGTVDGWCKRVREDPTESLTRQTYERMIADAEREAGQERYAARPQWFWAYSARLALTELVTGNPEGPTYELVPQSVRPPEK